MLLRVSVASGRTAGRAAVAGFGSLYGMLIGALFVGILPDLSSSIPVIGTDHGLTVVYAGTVILITFLMPNGFAGVLRDLVHEWRGHVVIRDGGGEGDGAVTKAVAVCFPA